MFTHFPVYKSRQHALAFSQINPIHFSLFPPITDSILSYHVRLDQFFSFAISSSFSDLNIAFNFPPMHATCITTSLYLSLAHPARRFAIFPKRLLRLPLCTQISSSYARSELVIKLSTRIRVFLYVMTCPVALFTLTIGSTTLLRNIDKYLLVNTV